MRCISGILPHFGALALLLDAQQFHFDTKLPDWKNPYSHFRFKRGRSSVICVNRITHQIISTKRKDGVQEGTSVGDNNFFLLMQQDVEWFLSRQQDAACIGLASSQPNGVFTR